MTRLLVLLTLAAFPLFGQDSLRYNHVVPVHAVKFSPLHLLNFYPTVQVAYETRIGYRLGLQIDAGYVVDWQDDKDDFRNKRGFKVKLEPRYYFGINYRNTFSWYLGAEGYLNHVNFDRQDTQEECFDLGCQNRFIRRYWYTMRYREPGLGVKIGFVRYYNRFVLDINGGFAVRVIRYYKPDDVQLSDDNEWKWLPIPDERNRTTIMPLLGGRVGYRFK